MPRGLHPDALPEFFQRHAVSAACESCGSAKLSVTAWDHYGAAPEDGEFLAALVICQDCEAVISLDRARLAGAP
ncbi:MAG: hypothetical protein ACTSQ7_05355 [Alphaproteobacteria bacterium]